MPLWHHFFPLLLHCSVIWSSQTFCGPFEPRWRKREKRIERRVFNNCQALAGDDGDGLGRLVSPRLLSLGPVNGFYAGAEMVWGSDFGCRADFAPGLLTGSSFESVLLWLLARPGYGY